MGYTRKPRQYRLKFESEDMEGFECLTRSVSLDRFLEISDMASSLGTGNSEDINKVIDILTENIVEWNLEDDKGEPVPVSAAVLHQEDVDFSLEILMAWMGAIASVDSPLKTGSLNGGTSQEDITAQLASLSRSQPN